ncbi:carbon storage regulator, CsrA [Neorhodopirellula lusitana]|uniref:Translational regulator CsrA n=1 Tax=Neorhodopirellula lusitana TaxID=445327 RepID=A0ABY1QHP9_9BACT|nr:response regulator [Neorhodopirellula lusitana]SMP71871.1 carbon storage regulator, CsrA [Neorhodopirellula lusitana]
MLVLSRKTDEAIVFPNLGITISILRTDNRTARVGIDAPKNIRVLRKELTDGSTEETFDVASFEQACITTSKDLHKLRNQLNTLNLGLQYYRYQMNAGNTAAANATFAKVISQLGKIEKSVGRQAAAQETLEATTRLNQVKVLLVEDDVDQREMLAGLLSLRGCKVATASSGDEALSYLEENSAPDYVLMDMRMPNGDGASTVRELRKRSTTTDLRILATSGTSPQELGVQQGTSGVERWFPKPINADALVQYMQCDPLEQNVTV